jgi:hypothetical protein
MKTRYSKPFESVQVKIPYNSGMDPYSGLVELFEDRGWLKKEGNKLAYTTVDGEVIKEFRKGYTDEILDRIMADVVARGQDMAYQGAINVKDQASDEPSED